MIKPSALFSDGAVLCRGKEIRIFGEISEGCSVRVVLTDAGGKTLAETEAEEKDGRFLAYLAPQEAQRGCTLRFESGGERTDVRNVAVGDVYLAGGQSNMELELGGADEGPACVRSHEDADLRFFNIPKMARVSAEQRKAVDETRWEAIAPGRGAHNSAVAYFFARRLRETRPEVPVGIIGCYWGGTSIACWLEEETLRSLAEGARYLDSYAEKTKGKDLETYLREEEAFNRDMDRWNRSVAEYRSSHENAAFDEITKACGICPWNPPAGPGSPYRPAGLAESMLHEAAPAALTGILYYQGEEDTARTEKYDELMILLIRRWRELFEEPELPFLFVQLPMWLDFGAEDTFLWPALRLQQAAARDLARNTAMVCLLDEGEYGNIHPTAKRVVGERLYGLAEKLIYRQHGEESPRALRKYTEGNTLTVVLSAPVKTTDGEAPRLLEAAGEDGRYAPARGGICGNTLVIRSEAVPKPVHARYAWTDYAADVNLAGENGLPLEPFRL